ncbi:hypothetical protein OIO90_001962 [Microbotryomycetes sp. JL221]|nr:hypothetical protein OIO90_001962 [Microbotryomycetes sp. JL221]
MSQSAPARQTPAMAKFTAQSSELALKSSTEPVKRAGFGTVGRKFPVFINTFEVTPPQLTAYHYDVKITPDNPPTPPRLNRQIWTHLDKTMNVFGGVAVAYDGRAMAFSPKKLPAEEGKWEIELPEGEGSRARTRQFTVTIRFTRTIDIARLATFVSGKGQGTPNFPDSSEIQSATQALNVVIQHGPTMLFPSRAASFFLPPENPQSAAIGKGLEMWRGFYTSLRPGPNKIFVNVDLASHPMYQSGNMANVCLEYLRGASRNAPSDLSIDAIQGRPILEINRFMRNLKIKLKVKGQDGAEPVRKVKAIESVSARSAKFELEDGTKHSVESYFKSNYGITLRNPNWPCVRVSKVALWPIELCEIESGQKYIKKLDPDQTANALKITTVGPRDRTGVLRQGLQRITAATGQAGPPPLQQWGLKINPNLMEVTARELPNPTLTYKRPLQPREGTWDMRGVQFNSPAKIDRWMVLVFDSDRYFRLQDAQSSISGLVSACKAAGMQIKNAQPVIHYVPPNARGNIPGFIQQKGSELVRSEGGPPQMIVCYLPRKPCDEYGVIKRFGDVEKGVATQCLLINKVKRGNAQYYANVSLKMNVKLNGINSILSPTDLGPIAEQPTMVIGADVSHPSPGSFDPSIAAVVGSMDSKCTLYGTSIRVQSSRIEVIANMDQMVLQLLQQFEARLRVKPKRLIMFRDGVSEGQFPQVLANEVSAIRIACKKLAADYNPQLTFIVVGKRHHISMFPKNPNDADRKNGNVKAGTIVDTDITSPFQFDWYTQSHASLLGTGRSAHYTVLMDDSKFSADTLQRLAYNLCFTYARCTRSVSYVTPAYYADRVCTRAQLLLRADDDDSASGISSLSGASEEKAIGQKLAEFTGRLKGIHPNLNTSLYFM